MSQGLSGFAIFWFLLSGVVVMIDLTYVLLRPQDPKAPHPLSSHPVFSQWVLYSTFDKRYAVDSHDAFVIVQSVCNGVEVSLQFLAVLLHLVRSYATAHKIALVVSIMTLYKTIMYGLMEHFEEGKYTKHNEMKDLLLMVVIPSSFWIIIPAFLARASWKKLTVFTSPKSPSAEVKKQK